MSKANIKSRLAILALGLSLCSVPAFGQEFGGGLGKEQLPQASAEEGLSFKDALAAYSLEELLQLEAAVKEEIASRSATSYANLARGDKGDPVTNLQNRLKELGYFSGMVNGKYDSETIKAMKRFEKANGLKNDGSASSDDQVRLFSESAIPEGGKAPETEAGEPAPQEAGAAEAPAEETTEDPYAAYGSFDYTEAAGNPDQHTGEKVKIIGTVVQVIPGTGAQTQLRLATSGYSDVVFVTIDYDLGYNILDNDKLTIYGTLNGLMTYESVLKETISIPLVAADEVKLQ